jgi:hypothetical protein
MTFRDYFPASMWLGRALAGRIARRIYVTIILVLLATSAAIRIHTYILTGRMQAVISGLSKLQIDRTTEEELLRTVPYLVSSKYERRIEKNVELGDVDTGIRKVYYVVFSNESSWMRFLNFAWRHSNVESTKDGRQKSWIFSAANALGYRYIGFYASVILLDNKISAVSYGIADRLTAPQMFGDIVLVRSFHSVWGPRQTGFEVRSTDDESPQFRVEGDTGHLGVSYAFDAPPNVIAHAFQVNLSCFWDLIGCRYARQVAPLLWQDKNHIEAATVARLQSQNSCPDRIIVGRFRYFPDMNVSLLESTGFTPDTATEEGAPPSWNLMHFKSIEVLRGRDSNWWETVRRRDTIPYPGDYKRILPNLQMSWEGAGRRALGFSGLYFDSCRIIPATPSALAAARNTIPAPRRAEDEALHGLM